MLLRVHDHKLRGHLQTTVRCISTNLFFTSPTSAANLRFKLSSKLPANAVEYVDKIVSVCQPESVHVFEGTEKDRVDVFKLMRRQGAIKPLIKYDNWLQLTTTVNF